MQGVNFFLLRDIYNKALIGFYVYALAILHEVVSDPYLAFVVELESFAFTLHGRDAAESKEGTAVV